MLAVYTGMMSCTIGTRDGDQLVADMLQYIRDVLDGSEDTPNCPHLLHAVDGEMKVIIVNRPGLDLRRVSNIR